MAQTRARGSGTPAQRRRLMPRHYASGHVSARDILRDAASRVTDPDDSNYGQPYEAVRDAAEDLTGEWRRSSTPLANLAAAVAAPGYTDTIMGTILTWAETAPPGEMAARMREIADQGS